MKMQRKHLPNGLPVPLVAVMDPMLSNVSEFADNKWHLAGTQYREEAWQYGALLNVKSLHRDVGEGTVISCTGWLDDHHHTMGWFVKLATEPMAKSIPLRRGNIRLVSHQVHLFCGDGSRPTGCLAHSR